MVKVSIVVPVYNASKYLKTCLDSLVNQTIDDMEIIAIDDASLDNSLDILKDYITKIGEFKVNYAHSRNSAHRNAFRHRRLLHCVHKCRRTPRKSAESE